MITADQWVRRKMDVCLYAVTEPSLIATYMAIRRYAWATKQSIFEDVAALSERGYVVSRVSRAKLCGLLDAKPRTITRWIRLISDRGWIIQSGTRDHRVFLIGEWLKTERYKDKPTYGVPQFWFDEMLEDMALYLLNESGTKKLSEIPIETRAMLASRYVESEDNLHRVRTLHAAVASQ